MTLRSPFVASALLIASLAGAACDVRVGENGLSVDIAEGKAVEEWKGSYTLPAGSRVDVSNVNGPIEVVASTNAQIEIVAERTARAGSDEAARELLKAVEIKEEVSTDAVVIETVHQRSTGAFGRGRVNVNYTVKVPEGMQVTVRTENGGVRLAGVRGTFDAGTTNGGIRAVNLSGAIKAEVINGGIRVDMLRVEGPVELKSVNGGVTVGLPAGVNAELQARAVNGGVTVQDSFNITTTERERRRVAGRLNAGGPLISLETTNGGVRVSAADGTSSRTDGDDDDPQVEVIARER